MGNKKNENVADEEIVQALRVLGNLVDRLQAEKSYYIRLYKEAKQSAEQYPTWSAWFKAHPPLKNIFRRFR